MLAAGNGSEDILKVWFELTLSSRALLRLTRFIRLFRQ